MSTSERVAAVRAFNRFYTGRIGLLRGGMHRTAHTLTEARLLYELRRGASEVAARRERLALDGGQLSRVLARLEDQRLIARERAPHDARRQLARLTSEGEEAFGLLDARSAEEIDTLLDALPEDGQRQVVGAFGALRRALDPEARATARLRGLRPGDLGWHVERHGALYSAEYGWDQSFERLCAGIVAAFDPERDAAWIAELDGQRAGGVLCIHEDDATARLRLLLVEPAARGHGLGTAL